MRKKFFQPAPMMMILLGFYILAFLIVHRSATLRHPAANMLYWYYSDNQAVEAVEFYGFWPLRQIAYHVPGFTSHHNRERIPLSGGSDL